MESVSARLQFLREPVPAVCPGEGIGHPRGMAQQVAQILPDNGSEWIGRAVASLTALVVWSIKGLHRPPPHGVALTVGGGAGDTG